MDYVLSMLKKHHIPVTRENYLGLAYPDGIPKDWGAEQEMGLPPSIRLKNTHFANSVEDMRNELSKG